MPEADESDKGEDKHGDELVQRLKMAKPSLMQMLRK